MTRRNNRRPTGARTQIGSGHGCLYPCCVKSVPKSAILCGPHFDALPFKLRQSYREARRSDPSSRGYQDAVAAITTWARQRAVAEQERLRFDLRDAETA